NSLKSNRNFFQSLMVNTIEAMAGGEPAFKATGDADQERLLIEAAQKDPRHFGELYEEHFERIYAFVARRVGDRDEAQDVTSEVFHRALSSISQFEWRGVPFAAWLFRIASNAIADRHHRVTREREFAARAMNERATSSEYDEQADFFGFEE